MAAHRYSFIGVIVAAGLTLLSGLIGPASAQEPFTENPEFAGLRDKMRRVGRKAQATSQEAALTPIVFTNVYSRPNDDRFQNGGSSGEPYEVARISATLQLTPERGGGWQARLIWRAVMVTGRHVESGRAFQLEVTTNAFSGAAPAPVRLAFRYPPGVTEASTAAQKRGSVLSADIDLGAIPARPDAAYRGGLGIVFRGTGEDRGTEQLEGRAGAVFQRLEWEADVREGRIARGDVSARRFADPQVRLVWSSYQNELSVQPYRTEPADAALLPEEVGDGSRLTPIQRQTVAVGRILVAARCISCHDSGNQSAYIMHDGNGVPKSPRTFAGQISSLLNNLDAWDAERLPGDRRRYPASMIARARAIPEADRRTMLEWVAAVAAHFRELDGTPPPPSGR
ncbi:MAG: hypothetical protein HYZ75_08910 [Elusimicrobia bacterium]|nr:hypothetical protein [Elusimicrobiota bacterium]